MNELDELRSSIDALDDEIVSLLKDRHELVALIAKYKERLGLEIYDPVREDEIISRALDKAEGLDHEFVKGLFMLILKDSKAFQEDILQKR